MSKLDFMQQPNWLVKLTQKGSAFLFPTLRFGASYRGRYASQSTLMRMHSLKAITLTVVCLGSLATAHAADWKEIGGNDDVTVLIDTTSIRRSGTRVKTWLKWVWKTEQFVPKSYPEKKYKTEKQLQISDCKSGTLAIAQSVRYGDSDGAQVVDNYAVPEARLQFSEAVPDTIGETIVKYACRTPSQSLK